MRLGPRKKQPKTNLEKIKYNDQQRKEMYYDEPHLMSNKKTQTIQWIEQPTDALVAAGSFWPVSIPDQHWCRSSKLTKPAQVYSFQFSL